MAKAKKQAALPSAPPVQQATQAGWEWDKSIVSAVLSAWGKPSAAKKGADWEKMHGSVILGEIEEKLGAWANPEKNTGPSFETAIKEARNYARHWFIGNILFLRAAFYNYGFSLQADIPSGQKELDKWQTREKREAIRTYVREVWEDYDLLDSAISLWQPRMGEAPVLLHHDQCTYSDTFGTPVLKYRHNLTDDQVKALKNISPAFRSALLKSKEALIPDDMFKVLKRAKRGSGLPTPTISGLGPLMSQSNSMEAGDAVLAFVCRTVLELHKIGHEIKQGPFAGSPKGWYSKERAEAFEKGVKGKMGHVRAVVNFDHVTEYPAPDMERFKGEKYQAIVDRLVWWALPLGHIILAKVTSANLMDLFRGMADYHRGIVGEHIGYVINQAFNPPVEVKAQWSDRCFIDARIAADLIKNGLAAGPVSQTTYLRTLGLNPDEERTNKDAEAKLPEEQTKPLYDPNHGDPEDMAGRPKGAGTGTGKV